MPLDRPLLESILAAARADGRETLLETEGYALLAAAGLTPPAHRLLRHPDDAATMAPLPGAEVVVKAASAAIAHKSDVGGVAFVPNTPDAIAGAARRMAGRLSDLPLAGFTVAERFDVDPAPGGELLLGLRFTAEFGPVVTLSPGGVAAEALGTAIPGSTLVLSPALPGLDRLADRLLAHPFFRLAVAPHRGRPPRFDVGPLVAAVAAFLDLAAVAVPELLGEIEVNPLVPAPGGRVVPLDVLARTGFAPPAPSLPRPLAKVGRMLRPRRAAVVGVSERMNPGRVLLRNMLALGFPADAITLVKPGGTTIDGCRCVPTIADLPEPVDLAILAIGAAAVPDAVEAFARDGSAESLVVIPGGLGETGATAGRAARIRAALDASRATPGGGPVVNGGNCLGIRSVPGRYDSMFIPAAKLPTPAGDPHPVAIVSQSGAFAISRASGLPWLSPRYSVSLGNQIDLTVGDWLEALSADPEVRVLAVYMEGFRPGDGLSFLRTARRLADEGRTVILYRAGRTAAGASASASHTASLAGDWTVTRELAEAAGILVADTIGEFDGLLALAARFEGRAPIGDRLAAMSNAGFECVALGDRLGGFRLASFAPETAERLASVFLESGVAGLVDVHNPLDVTPMMGDAGFAAAVAALLADPGVDAVIVGCVPFTPALNTLPPGAGSDEDCGRPDALASRLAGLWRGTSLPWVMVVDAGPAYDPFAAALATAGIPTFRSADRAAALLDRWRARRNAGRGPDIAPVLAAPAAAAVR